MAVKYHLTRSYALILIIIFALMTFFDGVFPDKLIGSNSATSQQPSYNSGINSWQNSRTSVVTADNGNSHEARAIDITMLKDLVKSGTQRLKNLAQSAKLNFVSSKRQQTDKLFTRYKVDLVKTNLLESKQFQRWAKHVMKNNPESGDVAMASKLMSHYGDDVFANILVTASSLERTKDKAKRLEEGLLTNWLATERSVDDVFTLLKMNEKGDEVFKSPVWGMWTSYLKKLGSENSDQLMFMVLRKHYDDDQLANILATTAKNYNTRGIAEKLEELQRASWLSSGKSADDVFHILKLNHEGDNLLKSQVLGSWVSYVKLLEKDPYEMLLFKLAKRYDAEALAIWLRAARDDYRSRSIATGIAEAQQKGWQKNGNSADDVFTLLKLDVEDALFLKSPVLDTWTSYVTKLKKDPNQLMFLKLETRYDDEGVAKVLLATKNDYTTRNAATTLENLLFQKWMSKDNSADGIFALLRLNKEGDKLFENPVFTTWESYVAKLDKANPDEAMFSVLKTHYSDQGLVKLVEIAKTNRRTENIAAKLQEEIWRNQGKTADDIFDLLKLNEKRGEMFATPEFTTWVAFVTKLNKLSKSPDEFPAISALTKRFGDVELARMLGRSKQDALRNKDLLKMVSDLQTQQFKQWHGQGKTPDDVSSMVMANGFDAKKDTRVILDYFDFYKLNSRRIPA